jgi:hypothetical protein
MAVLISTTAGVDPIVKIKYEKRFLEFVKQELQFRKAAQSTNYRIAPGEGKTIEWTQYLPKALVTTALTEGASGSEGSFTSQIKRATLEQWGAYDKYSDFLEYTAIDPRVMGLMEVQGTQASESIELETATQWAQTCGIPWRADASATHQFYDVAVTSAGTSTTVIASALTQADDFFNGGKIVITSGPGYGEARTITDFVASSDTLTVAPAFDTTPTTASKFAIATPGNAAAADNIVAGDVITSTNTKAALKLLRIALAKPIKGGFYMGILDPYTEQDMMADADWKNLNIYHAGAPQNLFEGEVGKLWGISFVRGTIPFRSAVATGGTYSATGLVHHVPILGKNSLGVVEADGSTEVILTPAKIADPALQMYSTMGWKVMWKAKSLNSCWSVDLMCGSA